MICFNYKSIQPRKIRYYIIVILTHICCNCHRFTVTVYSVSHWINCIMRNAKWTYFQVTNIKMAVWGNFPVQSMRNFTNLFIFLYLIQCLSCGINRYFIFSCNYTKSVYVVNMFMCNHNTAYISDIYVIIIKSSFCSLLADTCVNKNMCVIRTYIYTVTTTTAGNSCHSYVIAHDLSFHFYLCCSKVLLIPYQKSIYCPYFS